MCLKEISSNFYQALPQAPHCTLVAPRPAPLASCAQASNHALAAT
jgi:hypothetical protein